jgi:hypothetical protein
MTAHCWITTVPTSGEVQGLGPWRGLGQRPNLPLPQRQMVGAPAYNSTTAPIPRSGFVLGSKAAITPLMTRDGYRARKSIRRPEQGVYAPTSAAPPCEAHPSDGYWSAPWVISRLTCTTGPSGLVGSSTFSGRSAGPDGRLAPRSHCATADLSTPKAERKRVSSCVPRP